MNIPEPEMRLPVVIHREDMEWLSYSLYISYMVNNAAAEEENPPPLPAVIQGGDKISSSEERREFYKHSKAMIASVRERLELIIEKMDQFEAQQGETSDF